MPSHVINGVVATLIFASRSHAAQPQVVKWSDKSYGPDGPWAAVTVEIGTPAKAIDLLPGGSWMTNIFGPEICTEGEECPAGAAGLWTFDDSTTFKQIGSTGQLHDNFDENPGSLADITEGDAGWIFDNMVISATEGGAGFGVKLTVPDFSMIVFDRAQKTLPDGTKYLPTIGKLALGSRDFNQTWKHPDFGQFNGTLLTSSLFQQGRSPSNSYSMHVGSVDKKIPASLVMGGYLKDRALGAVSIQPYAFNALPIDLLDISIGVADGASPFNFTRKEGLLSEGDSTFDAGQQVTVDATQPYLYLPPTTCEAIASHLPVKFNKALGLYIWDEDEAQSIVTSPAFLEFKFRESGSVTDTIAIKVPFGLFYLTLSPPIIKKGQNNLKYFPCFHGQDPTGFYSLGRSFMQAALVGVKWQDDGGNWFLAQAPGPNTPKTVSPVPLGNTIESSATKWEDTWKGHWNVTKLAVEDDNSSSSSSKTGTASKGAGSTATLGGFAVSETPAAGAPVTDGSDGADDKDSSSGPPIGAIAGGAVGGVLLFGGAIVAFIFLRRRKAKKPTAAELPSTKDNNSDYYEYKAELCGERELVEMEEKSYQGRFGQPEGQEWRGNGYAHHGQGLGLGLGRGGHVSVHEMGTGRAPVEMYAPWSPKGI